MKSIVVSASSQQQAPVSRLREARLRHFSKVLSSKVKSDESIDIRCEIITALQEDWRTYKETSRWSPRDRTHFVDPEGHDILTYFPTSHYWRITWSFDSSKYHRNHWNNIHQYWFSITLIVDPALPCRSYQEEMTFFMTEFRSSW